MINAPLAIYFLMIRHPEVWHMDEQPVIIHLNLDRSVNTGRLQVINPQVCVCKAAATELLYIVCIAKGT
jgi:hypothetical protein